MICRTTLALGAMALMSLASSAAMAQNAPPSYEGDPDVYKVIFEDQNFRVIDSIRKIKRGLWAGREAYGLAKRSQSRHGASGAHQPRAFR